MTPPRVRLGLVLFALLSGALLVNLFYLQGPAGSRGQRVELGPSPEAGVSPAVGQGEFRPPPKAPAAEQGETTRAIQRELEQRGYSAGPPDGVAGLPTRAAIMAYEYDHGLTLTGEPSQDLLRAIVLGAAATDAALPRPPRPGPHAEQVLRTVQQSLAGLGYGPLKVDGFPGDETVRAIRRFEREQGMTETGRVSAPLVVRLAKLAELGRVIAPQR